MSSIKDINGIDIQLGDHIFLINNDKYRMSNCPDYFITNAKEWIVTYIDNSGNGWIRIDDDKCGIYSGFWFPSGSVEVVKIGRAHV